MKRINTIEKKIKTHQKSIKKFKEDKTLNPIKKQKVVFALQCLIRELKWVLN